MDQNISQNIVSSLPGETIENSNENVINIMKRKINENESSEYDANIKRNKNENISKDIDGSTRVEELENCNIKKEKIANSVSLLQHKDKTLIPELSNFKPEIIDRFMKKFGGFSKPNSLTNKERRFLKKMTSLQEKNKLPKRTRKSIKKFRPEKKMNESCCKQIVTIDLSYFNENLMRFIDMRMVIKQVHRCYSENRKLSEPLQLHITNITGEAEDILSRHDGYKNWDLKLHEKSYLEVYNKEDIIYLTSESDNVIEEFDDTKVYVIGGLLDHNSLKGFSHNRAIANGIGHARLPIDKYLNMKSLKVLPINQVYSIVALVVSGKSWEEALSIAIPQRKEATVKPADC